MATYTQDKLYDLWFDNKITERDLDLKLVQLHIQETSTAERKAEIQQDLQDEIDRQWDRIGCPVEHALSQEGL